MELRQLKYFVTVATEGQFIKAAEKLFVSQSALSQQVNNLEEELGVALFDKRKRKINRIVELTYAGEQFLKDAKKILELCEKAKEKLKEHQETEIRLGTYRMIHNQRIVEAIKILSESYPNGVFKMEEYETHLDIQEAVLNESIDYGISVRPMIDESLDSILLEDSELQILIYDEHPFSKNEIITLKELKKEKWIEIKASVHPIYASVENFLKKAGIDRTGKIVQEVASLELLCHYVSIGKGIALVPSFFDTSAFSNVMKKSLSGKRLIFEQCICFLKSRAKELI